MMKAISNLVQKETPETKKTTPALLSPTMKEGWVRVDPWLHGNFIPVIPDSLFANLTKLFLNAGGLEISGNFYIEPGSHTLEYVSVIRDPLESTVATVSATPQQAAERLRKDRENGYNPNGQWHTHGSMGAFWSLTDLTDQVKDVRLMMAFAEKGERYFMCISNYHFLVRRVRWDKGQVSYQDTPAYLKNGLELSGYKRAAPTYKGRAYSYTPGLGMADNPLLREVESIMDLADVMHKDPEFHAKLNLNERHNVFLLAEKRYGNLFLLTEILGAITVCEAVNIMFNRHEIEAADRIMKDKELIEAMQREEEFSDVETTL